jgi:hypothetical protein
MRGLLAVAIAAALLTVGPATSLAQKSRYPVFTADHLNDAMTTAGLAFALTEASVAKNDFENAKDYLVRVRDWLAPTITFWRDRKASDAVAMLRDTLAKLDALDAALSAQSVDTAAAARLVKQAAGSCDACHAKYREQDPSTKEYRVKAGVTEFRP